MGEHHHDNDDHEARDPVIPPAEAERPRGLLGRLIEAICKPGEANFDNP